MMMTMTKKACSRRRCSTNPGSEGFRVLCVVWVWIGGAPRRIALFQRKKTTAIGALIFSVLVCCVRVICLGASFSSSLPLSYFSSSSSAVGGVGGGGGNGDRNNGCFGPGHDHGHVNGHLEFVYGRRTVQFLHVPYDAWTGGSVGRQQGQRRIQILRLQRQNLFNFLSEKDNYVGDIVEYCNVLFEEW